MSRAILIALSIVSCFVFQSCNLKKSSFGADESHNMDLDRMGYHKPRGWKVMVILPLLERFIKVRHLIVFNPIP